MFSESRDIAQALMRRGTMGIDIPASYLSTCIIMAQQRKQERDFTAEVTALVPEVEGLAKVRQLTSAHTSCAQLMIKGRQVERGGRQDHSVRKADQKCKPLPSTSPN